MKYFESAYKVWSYSMGCHNIHHGTFIKKKRMIWIHRGGIIYHFSLSDLLGVMPCTTCMMLRNDLMLKYVFKERVLVIMRRELEGKSFKRRKIILSLSSWIYLKALIITPNQRCNCTINDNHQLPTSDSFILWIPS